MDKFETGRLQQLETYIPDIWNNKNCLYVGASPTRFHFCDKLKEKRIVTDIVEIDKDNCIYLQSLGWLHNIVCLDIRDFLLLEHHRYDLILWSHGPQLLPKEDFVTTINRLIKLMNNITVLMSPWGKYTYNEFELKNQKFPNIATFYEEDYKALGFETNCLGNKNVNNSNLLAWRYK